MNARLAGGVYCTPKKLLKLLGRFDRNVFSSNPSIYNIAPVNYTPEESLSSSWSGRIWCHPSLAKIDKYLNRFSKERPSGLAIVPCKTSAEWFHKLVLRRAKLLFLLKNQVQFYNSDGLIDGITRINWGLVAYHMDELPLLTNLEENDKGSLVIL